MATSAADLLPVQRAVYYPETDEFGRGQSCYHVQALFSLYQALERHFWQRKVHVAARLTLSYVEGDSRAVVTPDVMVTQGVGNHLRRCFQTWVEGARPCTVFEITCRDTLAKDVGPKAAVYARVGVPEVFIFDPEGEQLDPPLQGFRLKRQQYVRMDPDSEGDLTSEELGLRLRAGKGLVRLWDVATGAALLTPDDLTERAERSGKRYRQRLMKYRRRAAQERQRADALAAELARVKEELERLKRKP
jgi:Uma2 family endonuclease